MPPVVAMRRFASGEVTPELYAGTDTQAYLTGLRRLRNAYVMRMGGVQSRAGTVYRGVTKNNGAVRLFSVVFDLNENYVLEFGNLYVRIWRDGSLVSVGTPAAWVTATPYTAGVVRSRGGVNYVCILDHTSGASTEPGVGGSWTTAWYALTGTTFEYPTPYTTAQLSALQIAYLYRVVTIVHPSHPPANLTRLAEASWTLANIDFSTPSEAPTSLTASVGGTGGFTYAVTAVYADGSESGISNTDETSNSAFAFSACTLTWTAAAGAVSYNVYRSVTPLYTPLLLIGSSTTTTFVDNAPFAAGPGTPPEGTALFASANNYPAVIGAYQQRLLLAATNNNPDAAYASVSALPYDFTTRDPLVDSDSLSWRQVGQRLNRIRFFSEIGARLIQFTDTGETFVQGSEDNILRPGEVNPRQISWNGISQHVPPLLVDDTALYVQARGTQVRDLVPVNQEGYTGTELSRTALHFFDGYEIVDAAYQKVPHSVCWFVRDDGKVVSLTYVRESGIFGWALHDFGGVVERIVSVWEGDEDAIYFVVRRTIDGNTVRHVERMSNRLASVPVCVDSAVSASVSPSVPLGTWTEDETVATTGTYGSIPRPTGVAASTIVRLDETAVNAGHVLFDDEGLDANNRIGLSFYVRADQRSRIGIYLLSAFANIDVTAMSVDDSGVDGSGTTGNTWHTAPSIVDAGNGWRYVTAVLQVDPLNPDPTTTGRGIQLSNGVGWPAVGAYLGTAGFGLYLYSAAVVSGLGVLEGQSVAVMDAATGQVVASPYNATYGAATVESGRIAVETNASTVQVGLPFVVDVQTLDIDSTATTIKDRDQFSGGLIAWVRNTGAFWAGPQEPATATSVAELERIIPVDENWDAVTTQAEGVVEGVTLATRTRTGRVWVRQVDPLPLTILGISPLGTTGGR